MGIKYNSEIQLGTELYNILKLITMMLLHVLQPEQIFQNVTFVFLSVCG